MRLRWHGARGRYEVQLVIQNLIDSPVDLHQQLLDAARAPPIVMVKASNLTVNVNIAVAAGTLNVEYSSREQVY